MRPAKTLQISLLVTIVTILANEFWPRSIGQERESPQQGMGGAPTRAAPNYASRRTAGIVDPKAPAVFEDITGKTALNGFKHRSGAASKDYILEAPSGGVAIFDYDGDGRPDVYLVNGSSFEALQGKEKPPRAALYRNLGNWRFEDVTDKAGVANERWGFGVAVGDYNNDGHPDMYVSNYGVSRLYRNNGDGTFDDVTFAAGLGLYTKYLGWGTMFVDVDNDGWPDLLLVNGHVYPEVDKQHLGSDYREPRILYHNKRNGTFEDISADAGPGITAAKSGRGLAVGDLWNDGRMSAVVSNMNAPVSLLVN